MWIDTHAHLYDLDEEALGLALQACKIADVSLIVNTGTSLDSSGKVLAQSLRHKELLAAVGISPFDAVNLPDLWVKQLEELIRDGHVIAVGETGLDSTSPAYPDIKFQHPIFEAHCALSLSHNLPIVIHSRGSENQAVDVCVNQGVTKALFHCYTGDISALKKIIDAGYYVSFSGIITFSNSFLRELVEYVPIERILVETDSPYLAPVPFRGKKNQPAWVVNVGRKVAELKKMGEEETAKAIRDNFMKLFCDRALKP